MLRSDDNYGRPHLRSMDGPPMSMFSMHVSNPLPFATVASNGYRLSTTRSMALSRCQNEKAGSSSNSISSRGKKKEGWMKEENKRRSLRYRFERGVCVHEADVLNPAGPYGRAYMNEVKTPLSDYVLQGAPCERWK